MDALRRVSPGWALVLAGLGWACVVAAAAAAMADDRTRAGLALIVGGIAGAMGVAISVLGGQGTPVRNIAGSSGFLANAVVLGFVITFALAFHW